MSRNGLARFSFNAFLLIEQIFALEALGVSEPPLTHPNLLPSLSPPPSRKEKNPHLLGVFVLLGSIRMELVLKRSVSVVGVSCCKYLFIFL